MRLQLGSLAAGLLLLLSGCGMMGGTGGGIGVNFTPSQLGFEVDTDGTIVVATTQVTFSNPAGGRAARIVGYEITYVQLAGTPIPGIENEIFNYEMLDIEVPAGYECLDVEATACGVLERRMADSTSEPMNLVTLAGGVAVAMLESGHSVVRADITFHGRRDSASFEIPGQVTVTYPVAVED